MVPELIQTLERCIEIYKLKNADYSGSRGSLYNFEFTEYLANQFTDSRDKVYATMVGIKLARLAVLLSSTKEPNNESVFDSFDDAINYLALWKADRQRREVIVSEETDEPLEIKSSKNYKYKTQRGK